MMDSLESRVARHSKAKLAVTLKKRAYGVKLQDAGYFDEEQKKKPAIFAVKHQHMVDFVASIYVFRQLLKKEKLQIPVKESMFKFKPFAALLKGKRKWKAVGTIPKSYMLPMFLAARTGAEVYVAGINGKA